MNNIEVLVDNITKPKKNNDIVETKVIDTIQEQVEAPDTTIFCPESIKEKELIKASPLPFPPKAPSPILEKLRYSSYRSLSNLAITPLDLKTRYALIALIKKSRI